MEKYRDVMMFVCGLIVGLALMALFAPDLGKGKVPVDSRSLIVVDPGAKIPLANTPISPIAVPGAIRCKYLEEPCTAWVDSKTGKDIMAPPFGGVYR